LASTPLIEPFVVDDVGELYGQLANRLERIVRLDVRAPDPVVEDACQFAWSRLIRHCGSVRREGALSWLATTAVREAIRLVHRDYRDLSLDAALEGGGAATSVAGPDELLGHLQRLDLIAALPVRQQRLMWLHGLGLSYREIAAHEGCTTRTVERQLLRARGKLRQEAG
jgi:RNA polymerase sigma factor (sigma-70 family)